MNLPKIEIHGIHHRSSSFHVYPTTPPCSSLSLHLHKFLKFYPSSVSISASSILSPQPSFSVVAKPKFRFRYVRFSCIEAPGWSNEELESFDDKDASTDYEDLTTSGVVYKKTLRLVECSMFAALGGLSYIISSSLAIENYFGCFFALPIVFSSMRWDIVAGRKTMVATAILLLVLSGPLKALTYLLMHGLVGLTMGTTWRLRTSWGLSIFLSAIVRAVGAMGYVAIYSFLIRENILALITINIHASLTLILTSLGLNAIPSMETIYAIFGTLLLLNCGCFVFLLHLLYSVFFTRLGMKGSLTLPKWLERAI